MFSLSHSFSARLSALFLVLILGLGVSLTVLTIQSMVMFNEETEQKLNRTLAHQMAMEFAPFVQDSVDHESIEERIAYLTGINRRIEIYLLGGDGMIKASFIHEGQELKRDRIDTAPLEDFVAGKEVPIAGDDPLSPDRRKPFSASRISMMGMDGCWLYVILGGQEVESTAGMLRNSYIFKTTLRGLLLILLVAAIVGFVLFYWMTGRLRSLSHTIQEFRRGKTAARSRVSGQDEIGVLGQNFNEMADTIVANMEDLRNTDRLRRELIANVSHDLRSPLSTIQGYLETALMKQDELSRDQLREYLDIGLKNTSSLNGLVSQLFELSKLDAKQVEPEMEHFNLAELLQDLVMQFGERARQAGVELELEHPGELDAVYADIGLVERVLGNLIDNAIKYTPEGGKVFVKPANTVEGVRIEVRDTGSGIPEEDLPHIFERFYRVEKSRGRGRGGAGLGLSICKKIVELHGSALSVESRPSEGTAFGFTLPRATMASA